LSQITEQGKSPQNKAKQNKTEQNKTKALVQRVAPGRPFGGGGEVRGKYGLGR